MIRQIIVPTSNVYTLELPDELIGRQVEVLAFGLENGGEFVIKHSTANRYEKVKKAKAFFETIMVDTSNMEKYNREDLYE